LSAVGLSLVGQPADAAAGARYEAAFVDGARVEGEKLIGWGTQPGAPHLEETPLADPNRPLRWLCDTTLRAWEPSPAQGGFIEFSGGDRLPGKVVAVEPGRADAWQRTPAVLRVEPSAAASVGGAQGTQAIRVRADDVRRVVFVPGAAQPTDPGTVRNREGGTIRFRRLRWLTDGVTLLTAEGLTEVPMAEIAEIALPARDPWQEYYRRLARLSPDTTARLVRLETADGLVATVSTDRLLAHARGNGATPADWDHVVLPPWAFDPLTVRFDSIRLRSEFAPHEVPLSQFTPLDVVQRSGFGNSWTWRADRNVQGGPLQSGGKRYAWGFGVHARCELYFSLSACVHSLRSVVGIDAVAGKGGCVRAAVHLDNVGQPPLFQSPHLIGSERVVDTQMLRIAPADERPHQLVLVADAAHRDRPAGADPLDVRDRLDWLEPLLILDRRKLQETTREYLPELVPAWNGWQVSLPAGVSDPVRMRWDTSGSSGPKMRWLVGTGNRPLVLAVERQLTERDRWLRIHVRQVEEYVKPGLVEVRADGKPIARMQIAHKGSDMPWLVPLAPYQGRRAKIEVVLTAVDPKELVEWLALAITERGTQVDWRPLRIVSARAQAGTTLTVQPDGSILASGKRPPVETYEVRAESDLAQVTAFRLEALADPSLECGGPGRNFYGNFVLSQFLVSKPATRQKPIRGRYVRIELPGQNRVLNMCEVQVFVGEKNLAPAGRASQSTTHEQCAAKNAVDGNTGGDYDTNGISRTADAQSDPWWEVDLGKTHDIDRIVVFNRTDHAMGFRTTGLNVVVMDEKRSVVWRRDAIPGPPTPKIEVADNNARRVPMKTAYADYHTPAEPPTLSLTSDIRGWEVYPQNSRSHVAVFAPEDPIDTEGGLLIALRQGIFDHALGRFRLAATAEPLPVPVEPVSIEVPLPTEGAEPQIVKTPSRQTPPLHAKIRAATVLVEVEGRHATGVLVGKDGYVLTAGHLLLRSGLPATVTLTDGRKLNARTAGIYRDYDFGLLKIEAAGEYPGREISPLSEVRWLQRHPVAFIPLDLANTRHPPCFNCVITAIGQKTRRANHSGRIGVEGWPMFNGQGQIVGVQTGYGYADEPHFSTAHVALEHWERLVKGDAWGRWMTGSGPMIGVVTTGTENGGRVDRVYKDSPAAKAGVQVGDMLMKVDGQRVNDYIETAKVLADKHPGDEVTIEWRRADKTITKKIRLMPRRR